MANQIGLQNQRIRRLGKNINQLGLTDNLQSNLSGNITTQVNTKPFTMGSGNNFSMTAGQGLAAAGGVIQLGNQFSEMASRGDNINTVAPQQTFNAYGEPEYNIGQFAQEANSINPEGASFGDLASSTLSGAATGASIGGPVGGVIGGAIGLIGGAISGEAGRSEMAKKKQQALANLRFAQKQYNDSKEYFNTQQSARSQYNDMNNPYTRQNNLYQANNPYA